MSTGTKIVKSGSEPPTALELDVSQVGISFVEEFISFVYFSNSVNSKEMHNSKVNYVNFI
jgi:hypothetical protein